MSLTFADMITLSSMVKMYASGAASNRTTAIVQFGKKKISEPAGREHIHKDHEYRSAGMGQDNGWQECGKTLSKQDLAVRGGRRQKGFKGLLNLLTDNAVRSDRVREKAC